RYHRAQDPIQLGNLGDVALPKEDRPGRVQAQGQERQRRFQYRIAQYFGVLDAGERVQIGDEIEAFAFVLKLDELPDRPVIVSQVEVSGRLDSREDAHGLRLGLLHQLLDRIRFARQAVAEHAGAVLGDHHHVLDANSELLFGDVDAGLQGDHHVFLERLRVDAGVVHLEPDEVTQPVDEIVVVTRVRDDLGCGVLQLVPGDAGANFL